MCLAMEQYRLHDAGRHAFRMFDSSPCAVEGDACFLCHTSFPCLCPGGVCGEATDSSGHQ